MLGTRFTFEIVQNKLILEDDNLIQDFVQFIADRLRCKFPHNKITVDNVQINKYYSQHIRVIISITVFHLYFESFTKGLDEVNE